MRKDGSVKRALMISMIILALVCVCVFSLYFTGEDKKAADASVASSASTGTISTGKLLTRFDEADKDNTAVAVAGEGADANLWQFDDASTWAVYSDPKAAENAGGAEASDTIPAAGDGQTGAAQGPANTETPVASGPEIIFAAVNENQAVNENDYSDAQADADTGSVLPADEVQAVITAEFTDETVSEEWAMMAAEPVSISREPEQQAEPVVMEVQDSLVQEEGAAAAAQEPAPQPEPEPEPEFVPQPQPEPEYIPQPRPQPEVYAPASAPDEEYEPEVYEEAFYQEPEEIVIYDSVVEEYGYSEPQYSDSNSWEEDYGFDEEPDYSENQDYGYDHHDNGRSGHDGYHDGGHEDYDSRGEWEYDYDTDEWVYVENSYGTSYDDYDDSEDEYTYEEPVYEESHHNEDAGEWIYDYDADEWVYVENCYGTSHDDYDDSEDEYAYEEPVYEERHHNENAGEWIYDYDTDEWVYVEGSYDESYDDGAWDDDEDYYDEDYDDYDYEEYDEVTDEYEESYSSLGEQIVGYAMGFVGVTPYVPGGRSLYSGTDCSGFVNLIYDAFGIYCSPASMAYNGSGFGYIIGYDQARAGDIAVYGGGSHVAIYAGNGNVVHCSSPENGTVCWNMNYRSDLSWFLRVID